MRRTAVGLIALGLLSVAGAMWLWPAIGSAAVMAACLKVGALMVVLWLAYDELSRLPAWILAGVPVLLLLMLFTRSAKWLLFLVPILIVMAILKPRRRN